MAGGWSRRAVVRAGAAAIGGAGLAALAPAAGAVAVRPVRSAANPVVISVHASLGGVSWPPNPTVRMLIYRTMEPLLRQNPGLKVELFPTDLYEGAVQASMLAGNGPDIWADYILDGFTSSQLAMDLAPLVQRDNIDLSVFQQGQVRYIREVGLLAPGTPIGLCALPAHAITASMAVNLSVLDEVGYKYPEPTWTYLDWQKMWEATTVKAAGSRKARYGLQMYGDFWVGYNHSYNMPGAWLLHGWGGEFVDPNNPARCYLDNPGSIAAGEWAYNVVYSGIGGKWGLDFGKQDMVSYFFSSDALPTAVTSWRGFKWDIFDFPVWPKNVDSYTSTDSWGIWSGTKHPEAAWTVLKWLALSPDWLRLMMRIALMPPSQNSLVEEWVTVMRATAPPLRDKNLDVYLRQAQADDQYVGYVFRYASQAAEQVIGDVSGLLDNRKVSVAAGFTEAAKRINAIEQTGAATSAQQARFQSRYQAEMAKALAAPSTYRFAPPARTGAGQPPVAVPAMVTHKGDTWRVEGGGGGVMGGPTTQATFACAPVTAPSGVFTCRLTAIQAVKPSGSISDGARFGLMVRADLSDQAPSLGVEVAAGRGVHSHSQPWSAASSGDFRPAAGSGYIPASQILLSDSKPAANYLTRPVWLRLVRQFNRWIPYASLDGKTWLSAGGPRGAEILGCWVGIYVTAHNAGTLVSATFDNLQGFTPNTFVRIGAP